MTTGKGQFDKDNIVNLSEVLHIPTLRNNLFSITKEIKTKESMISNDDDVLILNYPDG